MISLEELQEADLKTILDGNSSDGQPFLKGVFELYRHYFGEACENCPSKIKSYISRLKNLNTNAMAKKDKKYILKAGVTVRAKGGKIYSEHNITDKIAADLLKENPKREVLFSRLPEKGKQKQEQEKSGDDFTLAELREMYPDIKAKTKKDFVTQIDELENENGADK